MLYTHMCDAMYKGRLYAWRDTFIQPIVDRVAQHLEIISKKNSTNQNSAHRIYD